MRQRRGDDLPGRIAHGRGAATDPQALVDVLAGELLHPLADRLAIAAHPAAQDLARFGVERIEGDLRSVHIEPS